jgi:hypothetical protein
MFFCADCELCRAGTHARLSGTREAMRSATPVLPHDRRIARALALLEARFGVAIARRLREAVPRQPEERILPTGSLALDRATGWGGLSQGARHRAHRRGFLGQDGPPLRRPRRPGGRRRDRRPRRSARLRHRPRYPRPGPPCLRHRRPARPAYYPERRPHGGQVCGNQPNRGAFSLVGLSALTIAVAGKPCCTPRGLRVLTAALS